MPSGLQFFTPKQVAAVSRAMSPRPMQVQTPQVAAVSNAMSPRPMQVQALGPQWDSKHPNWGGSYIAFWSMKVQQTLDILPKLPIGSGFSRLGQRVRKDPSTQVKLINFLRQSYAGPLQLVSAAIAGEPGVGPLTASQMLPNLNWNDYPTVTMFIARFAAKAYLDSLCMASSGRRYDEHTGECAMHVMLEGSTFPESDAPSGVLGARPSLAATRPVFRPKSRPMLKLAITWDTLHPGSTGSFGMFWSAMIYKILLKLRKFQSYDLSPLAQRLANDPQCHAKLMAWLRGRWSGPQAFIQSMPGAPNTMPTLAELAAYTYAPTGPEWNSGPTHDVAMAAAAVYLNDVCRTAGPDFEYSPKYGECKRRLPSGEVMQNPYGQVGARPALAAAKPSVRVVPRPMAQAVSIPWNAKVPQGQGPYAGLSYLTAVVRGIADRLTWSIFDSVPRNQLEFAIQQWVTRRWPSFSACMAEIGFGDDTIRDVGALMFTLWYIGWDSTYRGAHYRKCGTQRWDPYYLRCV